MALRPEGVLPENDAKGERKDYVNDEALVSQLIGIVWSGYAAHSLVACARAGGRNQDIRCVGHCAKHLSNRFS
jgi:hypothetical protein